MHTLWDELCAYLKDTRPVPGQNVTITDAPGGGKLISAGPEGVSQETIEPVFMLVNGQFLKKSLIGTDYEEPEEP